MKSFNWRKTNNWGNEKGIITTRARDNQFHQRVRWTWESKERRGAQKSPRENRSKPEESTIIGLRTLLAQQQVRINN